MVLKDIDFRNHGSIGPDAFSFVQSELDTQLKLLPNLQTYDKCIPATWPLITLDRINQHCGGKYTGLPELPHFVAYQPTVMNVFISMHSKQHLKRNGETLHSHYPANFTQRDIRKSYTGMTTEEEEAFTQEMQSKQEAEAEAEQHRRSPTAITPPLPAPQTTNKARPCQNAECNEDRKQKAILKGLLSKRDSELRDVKQEFRDFAKNNGQEIEDKKGVAQLRLRAEAAEKQCKDLIEHSNIQTQKIRQLERQVATLTGEPQPQALQLGD